MIASRIWIRSEFSSFCIFSTVHNDKLWAALEARIAFDHDHDSNALFPHNWETLEKLLLTFVCNKNIILGAGMVALPSQLTMDNLQYPAMGSLSNINYHHLCVTWSKLIFSFINNKGPN